MSKIDKVRIDGIRGVENREVTLDRLNLITGPNGSGKSTIPVGIDFVLLGLVPGYKKTEMFDNATDHAMSGVVTMGDNVIERTLTRGKTMRERISVNGGDPADAKAAAPLLQAILGKSPPVLNMPAFWACSSSEKRRMLLRLVADADTQKALAEKETTARGKKNDLADVRRGAEKAVESLQKSLAQLEKPAGNLDALKAEKAEIETELEVVRDRVSTGEANDKARIELSALIDAVPAAKEEVKELKQKKAKIDADAASLAERRGAMGERPTVPSQYNVSDEILAIVVKSIHLLERIDDSNELCNDALELLNSLLPDPEENTTATRAIEDYDKTRALQNAAMAKFSTATAAVDRKLAAAKGRLDSAKEAGKKIESIGDGLAANDPALKEGLEKRLVEAKAKIEPLEEIAVLSREVEKAQLDAEEALANEETAKVDLDAAVFAQSKIVAEASDMLATRSKEILPYGNLRLEDDGKDVTIMWAKSETLSVPRTTLSGGEQALFDNATGHSLAPEALIVIEAAEIDNENIVSVMERITETCPADTQVIVLTCHAPPAGTIPEGWNLIELSGEAA